MLNVAMVTNFPLSPPEVWGGVEAASLHLAEGLAALGQTELHVVDVGRGTPAEEVWERPTATVWRVPGGPMGLMSSWNLTRWRVEKALRRVRPDVVHVQGFGGWVSPSLEVPRVLTVHGIIEEDLKYRGGKLGWLKRLVAHAVESRSRRRYGHVIVISPYVLERLKGELAGKTYPIENAVAADCFDLERREVPNRLLYIGSVSPRKNIHGLLAMARHLKAMGVAFHLQIAGAADPRAYLDRVEGLRQAYGLTEEVRFLGSVPPDGVRRELAEAACLVLASFQETAPVVISEAMAGGIPVVATAVCGVPYMVDEGKTGYAVPSGDMAALAEKVAHVLGSAALRREMGARAAASARQRFHPEIVAQRTLDVYADAIGR